MVKRKLFRNTKQFAALKSELWFISGINSSLKTILMFFFPFILNSNFLEIDSCFISLLIPSDFITDKK